MIDDEYLLMLAEGYQPVGSSDTLVNLAIEVLEHREGCTKIALAARAHLAADDALSAARRTDAADVPTAEARALSARECLAGLVGYTGEVGR